VVRRPVADEVPTASARPALSPRARGWLITLLVGVLTASIGFGIGVFTGMPRHPAEGSADAGFARDMSTHHAQAVSLATDEYRATSDGELRQISVDIALTQQAQIGMMLAWLQTWGLPASSKDKAMAWMPGGESELKDGLMPGMATNAEREKLRAASGREKDVFFCQLMIQHHLGGIHMIDAVLEQGENHDVRELAQTIKDGQQYEITVLQKKLKELGAEP
jgi:uncharacterized protein (DUF305 family)